MKYQSILIYYLYSLSFIHSFYRNFKFYNSFLFQQKQLNSNKIYNKINQVHVDENENIENNQDLINEAINLVFTDEHVKELNRKVEIAIEDDYDRIQGVHLHRKDLPLKANIDLLSYQARQFFLKGNFTYACELYEKCISYDPTDGRAWLGLARIYWKKRDLEQAEKCYKDGLYYNKSNSYLLQGYAIFLEKIGRLNEAMKLLQQSTKLNPKHTASWVALAKILLRISKLDEARVAFQKAIEYNNKSYVAYQAFAVMEQSIGNYQEATRLFQLSLELSPESIYTLQAYATMQKKIGNYEAAEKLLRDALRIMPSSTRVRLSCAELYELKGDIYKANQVFIDGKKYAQQFGDAGFFQSWAIFESKYYFNLIPRLKSNIGPIMNIKSNEGVDFNDILVSSKTDEDMERYHGQVRSLFKEAIKANKFHSASWIAWAKFEESIGNLDIARRLLVSGITQFPHSKNIAWFHCALAHLANIQGDINTARACYSRALESTPSHSSLAILLEFAKFEETYGFNREARNLYELAIKRFPKRDDAWINYIASERKKAYNSQIQELNTTILNDTKVNVYSLQVFPDDSLKVLEIFDRRSKQQM